MKTLAPWIPVVMIVVIVFMTWNWRARYFDYQCEKCGDKYSLPIWAYLLSVNAMGRRFLKCPRCGRWSWVSPVPKE